MTSPDPNKHPLFHQIRETVVFCEGDASDQTVLLSMAMLQRMHRGLADTAKADLREAVSELRKMISPENPTEPTHDDLERAVTEIVRAADEQDEAIRTERALTKELHLLGFDETDISKMLVARLDVQSIRDTLANDAGGAV